MIYRQFLAMRKGLLWFLVIVAGVAAIGVATQVSQGHGHPQISLREVVMSSAWPCSMFAAVFGIGLANASRGPARIIWTLPAARWQLALQLLAIDAIGIAIALVVTCCVFYASFISMSGASGVHGSLDWGTPFVALSFLFAVYGWSAIIGVLLRRVAFRAVSFPLLLLWALFGQMGGVFGAILRAPIALNPFAILMNVSGTIELRAAGGNLIGQSLAWMAGGWEIPMLLGTGLVLCAATVVLWQRAEVLPA
jgi:hypothetical protein